MKSQGKKHEGNLTLARLGVNLSVMGRCDVTGINARLDARGRPGSHNATQGYIYKQIPRRCAPGYSGNSPCGPAVRWSRRPRVGSNDSLPCSRFPPGARSSHPRSPRGRGRAASPRGFAATHRACDSRVCGRLGDARGPCPARTASARAMERQVHMEDASSSPRPRAVRNEDHHPICLRPGVAPSTNCGN